MTATCYGCGGPLGDGLSIDMSLTKLGKVTKVSVHILCFGKAEFKARQKVVT